MRFSTIFKVGAIALAGFSFSYGLPKASEVYPQMGLGYNIGNTMEVPGDPTKWGNIFPNEQYVNAIKKAGFNTIRIPCAWDSHASNGVINDGWLDSVKTVVDYAIKNQMFVMLNSHWDNGWLEDNVFEGKHKDRNGNDATTDSKAIAALQKKYWTQIANKFKDYDEHLIFASANEPGVNDHRGEGASYTDNGQLGFKEDRMDILKMYHEACLKAVRATGGNNETRTVVVQMPRTEADKASLLQKQYPVDPAGEGYTMAEFHYYPYQMAFMPEDESWGKVFYYWEDVTTGGDPDHTCKNNDIGSKNDIEKVFGKMQQLFVDKGIPVVIGEMGIARHYSRTGNDFEKHMEARAAWYAYTVASAKSHGLVPVVWDNGVQEEKTDKDDFTLIRHSPKYNGQDGDIVDSMTINAMVKGFAEAPEYKPAEKIEVSENDKALWVEYHTKSDKTSETGTIRLDFNGGKDWSAYEAITFQIRTEPVSVIACEGNEAKGCNGYAWTSVDAYALSNGSDWYDSHLGSMDDFKDVLTSVTLKLSDLTDSKDQPMPKTNVTTFGINVYATQLTGSMYINNILLIKADGSADTLQSFDADLPQFAGIASGMLIAANADGKGPEVKVNSKPSDNNKPTTAIKPTVATASKLMVNVQPGLVSATFTAAKSGLASAMLVNGLGQVIATQSFNANVGANSVQLTTGIRGNAYLVVKQGSQKFVQAIRIK